MFYRMLGPLEVWVAEGWTGVAAPKWRALLAALLLYPGQVVPTEKLVDELWSDDPPPGARKLVSGYVSRLRRLIDDRDGRVLVTQAPGYRLLVDQADLDISRFEELMAAGRGALETSDGRPAAEFLAGALELWRGPALADVPRGPLVAAAAVRLEELRLAAVELRVEARIRCGHMAELVAELRQLTAGYPFRERFWGQLMRVLEQSGRPAEALEVYAQAKKILAAELGADPGPDLRQLHHRLLAGDATETVRSPAARSPTDGPGPATVAPPPPVLRQLPATVPHFVGRADEVAALTELLGPDRARLPGTVVISAIDGMPGVGKTTLAVHVGHLLAHRFPDRQLFVDLHGHTPGQQPADPLDVLAGLLAGDGVDPRGLPGDLDGRAAMWRDRVADQRVLLVLDNAASSGQVAPLLPGTAQCLVLVTSRRFLGDLPAAVEVPLDTLPPGDARTMFANLAPRAASEPAAVAELVALCGNLPLAIALLARLFTRHRSWIMADLIAETRARLLTISAENRTVAAAFELSYQDLDVGRQRFFRRLGLHPGADVDSYAAAALAGLPLDQAAGHLDELHGDRLLEEPVPRRYRMHDLVGQYARSLAAADSASEREQAAGRLLDYYQHTAEAADLHLGRPARRRADRPASSPALALTPPLAPVVAPGLAGRHEAQAWMAAERANLVACIGYAAARHEHARVAALTAAMAAHLRSDGPWPQAMALHAAAARAAEHLGDQPGHAGALLSLGAVRRVAGDRPGAADALQQSLDIYCGLGDRLGEANALFHLGDARRVAGDYPEATDALLRSLDIYRALGDRLGEASALFCLGDVQRMSGDYKAATDTLQQSLDISGDLCDRLGEASARLSLGAAREETGDYRGATEVLNQALDCYRSLSDRFGEANALYFLGEVRRATRDYPGATDVLQQSLDICRSIGARFGEANTLCSLGAVRRETGDYPGATDALEQALGISRSLGYRLGEAEALNQTAAMHLACGDPRQARACHQRALDIAAAIGSPLEQARALEGIGKCAAMTCVTGTGALRQALEIYRRIGAAAAVRLAAELDGPH
jgi:DNA-binding SARP family transcriptional activator/tetratricopeptide (TPR) repeat protein